MRFRAVFFLFVAALGGAAACSNNSGAIEPTSTSSVTGTVQGQSLSTDSAMTFSGEPQGFAFKGTFTVVSFGGLCDPATGSTSSPTLTMALALVDGAGDSTPITTPGTYQVVQSSKPPSSSGLYADALFNFCDQMMEAGSSAFLATDEATSGTVTVDTISASDVMGSIDVYFAKDHLAGSFDATTCTGINVVTTPMCE